MTRITLLTLAALVLGACGGRSIDPAEMSAATVAHPLEMQRGAGSEAIKADYQIGAGDLLQLTVFQVEDLSFEQIRVDAAGNLQLPLLGSVPAAGHTPAELSSEIARRLAVSYLRDPQVSVVVREAASQKITIDGAVTKPGVYEMQGRTTLLQAVAMAEGPQRTANLSRVAVFRSIGGERKVAVFDLQAIRQGRMDDPVMFGDDVVVVDSSQTSVLFRDFLTIFPTLGVFATY